MLFIFHEKGENILELRICKLPQISCDDNSLIEELFGKFTDTNKVIIV